MLRELLQLREHFVCGFFGVEHDVQGSSSFAVKSHVFGKGLRDEHLEAKGDEVSDRPSILLEITSRKALIGRVEEGNQIVLLHDLGQSFPLLSGWIEASWVVCA